MHQYRHLSAAVVLALAGLGAGISSALAAASACKVITEASACTALATCTWVDAYKTKKGKQIAAYCRLKHRASLAGGPSNGRTASGTATTTTAN